MSLRDHRDTFVVLKTSVVVAAIGLFLRGSEWPTRGLKIFFDPLCLLAAGDHRPVLYYGGGGGSRVVSKKTAKRLIFFSCLICELSSWGYHAQTYNIIAPKQCAPWGLSLTATTCVYRGVYIGKTGSRFWEIHSEFLYK